MSNNQALKSKAKGRGSRPRGLRIDVWVNDEEKMALTHRAHQTGLSLSAYMKVAGLNQPIRSRADLLVITDLVKVNADLGCMAGLLKLWLDKKPEQGTRPKEVEILMKDLRQLQNELRSIMAQLVK